MNRRGFFGGAVASVAGLFGFGKIAQPPAEGQAIQHVMTYDSIVVDSHVAYTYDPSIIKIGDALVLKSGGPMLIVEDFENSGKVICSWKDSEGKRQSASFHVACLAQGCWQD